MSFPRLICIAFLLGVLLLPAVAVRANDDDDVAPVTESAAYSKMVQSDRPIAYWRFDGVRPLEGAADGGKAWSGKPSGSVDSSSAGPRAPEYPLFAGDNTALSLRGNSSVRIADRTGDSPLKFRHGDSITLEAWVNPTALNKGQYAYIIGKGRTGNPGVAAGNQNYSLRLHGADDTARVSFLFRSVDAKGQPAGWHRWNSSRGFAVGAGWQHVAITYTFGDSKSLLGYLNGKRVDGTWDNDGPTDQGPLVDNDDVWIGSSLTAANSFAGSIDEVAIYRAALGPEQIAKRYARTPPKPYQQPKIPANAVLAEIIEFLPDKWDWNIPFGAPTEHFFEKSFAMVELVQRYNDQGLRVDRSNPHLLRLTANVTLPPGPQQLLVRTRGGSRLFLDDQLLGTIPFNRRDQSRGRQGMYKTDVGGSPNMAPLMPGDRQQIVEVQGDGKTHRIRLDVFVAGRKSRPEVGNLSVALAAPGKDFQIISPAGEQIWLTGQGWQDFGDRYREEIILRNAERRHAADTAGAAKWAKRHEQAREYARTLPEIAVPEAKNAAAVNNELDRFVVAKLEAANLAPGPVVDDWGFLRRVSLDVRGLPPTPEEAAQFFADKSPDRRAKFIDRMLADPSWADRWVGYWQDVLAENPNMVNPTLNNTGPFRWWIYESFLDNKPLDRFAAELIEMQGSKYFGGPAGFELATENDVPMADKAQIIGEAFLGISMNCARCHDAPHHDVLQEDLFSIAAMLKRSPEGVPKTSTIDRTPAELAAMSVKVTLKPGSKVSPKWPFDELIAPEAAPGLESRPGDSRSLLAALITAPQNKRFAPVMVNRLWQRFVGTGFVGSVHDWEGVEPSHPELLDWLARDFMLHDYDLKHTARRILNSQTYQRAQAPGEMKPAERRLLAYAVPRRLDAEQIVDSLFAAAGKPFNAEEQNIDIDTIRRYDISLNMGMPRRAWQFTSMSNERDRPSLALPASQSILAIMENYGWRGARQNPVSLRNTESSVLQAAILANGSAARRIVTLSDDSALTELMVSATTVEELVRDVYVRVLDRPPTPEEQSCFVDLLKPGFSERLTGQPARETPLRLINMVAWTNHVEPEANTFKTELEKIVEQGDPPSARLAVEWQQRASDLVWTLINSPEFVMVP